MTELTIVALIAGSATVVAALLGIIAASLVRQSTRIRGLEHRERLSWLYIRSLIDHAYRHGAVPLPEPPKGWLDEDDE